MRKKQQQAVEKKAGETSQQTGSKVVKKDPLKEL